MKPAGSHVGFVKDFSVLSSRRRRHPGGRIRICSVRRSIAIHSITRAAGPGPPFTCVDNMQTYMIVSICAVSAACAATPHRGTGAPPSSALERVPAASRGEAVLPPEILAASVSDAYEAVRRLRPGFFANGRTAGSGHAPVTPSVVLESGFPEQLGVLKLVAADMVAAIYFVEPLEATHCSMARPIPRE